MKMKIQVIIEYEDKNTPVVEEAVCLHRGELVPESLGLTLDEGRTLLEKVQENMVTHQVKQYIDQNCHCPVCHKELFRKGIYFCRFVRKH